MLKVKIQLKPSHAGNIIHDPPQLHVICLTVNPSVQKYPIWQVIFQFAPSEKEDGGETPPAYICFREESEELGSLHNFAAL